MKLFALSISFILLFSVSMPLNNSLMNGISKIATKAIVYILPYEKCNDYWAKTYGDRIYYYVYGNVSEDRNLIDKDFGTISSIYDMVIIGIPADDTQQYLENISNG